MRDNAIMQYIKYEIVDGEVTIDICDKNICGDVTIPDMIEGYPVTKIAPFAFAFCNKMKSVIISKNIKEIGQCAFFFDSLPKGLYYSGEYADWKKIKIGDGAIDFSVDVYSVTVNRDK